MAVIGKIRSYSGLLVIIVGVALAAFVLGDFLRKGPKSRITDVGKIAGEEVTYREFEQKVEEQIDQLKQQSGQENVSADQIFQLRQQVWNQLEKDIIMGKEYEELGLVVSPEELFDMIQGKNPHQYIIKSFTDPKTGQFNPSQVINFLKNLDQADPKIKNQWLNLEKYIKEERLTNKYNNLIKKGYYVTKLQAKKDYENKNKSVKFVYFSEKYNTIADSTVKVTDKEIETYYNNHKQEYQQEDSRDLEYVIFDVLPSNEDKIKIENEVKKIRVDFEKETNIESFVNFNSDRRFDSIFYKKGSFSQKLDSLLFNVPVGTIVGPFFENNKYEIAKLLRSEARPDSMMASHILISYKGAYKAEETIKRTKAQAKKTADSLVVVLKKDKDLKNFASIAKTISNDPSAKENGGDLKWFADESMVKPFNDACLNGKVGDLKVVETEFGYHVIKVTGKKEAVKKVKVALIERNLVPSNQTFQNIFLKASEFAGENKNIEQFDKTVQTKGLNKRVADNVKNMDNNIPGLNYPRELIRWAFDASTEKGSVSKVFEMEGKYVVAALKTIKEKGNSTLDQIRNEVEKLAKRDKKAEEIIKKFENAYSSNISINDLATKLKAKTDTLDNIRFSSYYIPSLGPEPELMGTLFAMKDKTLSKPIKGKNGVYVVYIESVTEPIQPKDYKMNEMQIANTINQRAGYEVFTALQKITKITDNRVKFY